MSKEPDAARRRPPIDPEALYNTPEAALRLGLSESWLAKRRVDGTGPRYTKLGRAVRYLGRDLITYLENRKRRSTSEPSAEEEDGDAPMGRRNPKSNGRNRNRIARGG